MIFALEPDSDIESDKELAVTDTVLIIYKIILSKDILIVGKENLESMSGCTYLPAEGKLRLGIQVLILLAV